MKKTIRLSESDFHRVIKESVRGILRESTGLEDAFREVDFTDPEDREAWNSISNYVGSTREKVDQIIDDIYNGNYNKEIEQRTIWQKLQEIIPDLDSFMCEKFRNQIQNAINDQMSVADKEYAFKYGQEDHYGDDGYYEDEYGDWRHSFTDHVESDLTCGDSYDWNTSDDPYDSHEMRRQGLRNMNVFTTNDPRKRAEVDKAWDEHDSLERAKRRPDLFKKNGQLRKDSALDRKLKPRSNKHGATQAADKVPLHRKGSLNRVGMPESRMRNIVRESIKYVLSESDYEDYNDWAKNSNASDKEKEDAGKRQDKRREGNSFHGDKLAYKQYRHKQFDKRGEDQDNKLALKKRTAKRLRDGWRF